MRFANILFVVICSHRSRHRAATTPRARSRQRAHRRRHRRRANRERAHRPAGRADSSGRPCGEGGGAGECRAGRPRRQDRDPRADRSALPHRERPAAGAAAAGARHHGVPRSGAVEREVRRVAQDGRGRRPARPAHLHDRPAHRRREPRLPRRLGRRPRRRRGAPACRDERGTGCVSPEDLLPASDRQRQGGDRRLQRAPDPVYGAPRGARRRGADRSRAARCRAHHLVRRRPRASPAGRDLPPGRPAQQRRTPRRPLSPVQRHRSGWARSEGALRRRANSGVRGSMRRSPCSSGARTSRPKARAPNWRRCRRPDSARCSS